MSNTDYKGEFKQTVRLQLITTLVYLLYASYSSENGSDINGILEGIKESCLKDYAGVFDSNELLDIKEVYDQVYSQAESYLTELKLKIDLIKRV